MKESIAAKLAALERRLKEIDTKLADPEVTHDLDNYRKLSQERSEIEPVVAGFGDWRKAQDDVAAAEEMAKDPQMREFAQEEIAAGRERVARIEAELQAMLLPRDPNDERNLFLEIRAGDDRAVAGEDFEVPPTAHVVVKARRLEDRPDSGQCVRAVLLHADSPHECFAAVGINVTEQNTQGRAFPRAIVAKQAEDFAGSHRERDAGYRRFAAKRLVKFPDLDRGHCLATHLVVPPFGSGRSSSTKVNSDDACPSA